MKTSARFLAMLLAVVMIASAALSVSAFSDVTGAVEHATAIEVLAQLGVIGGYEDGTFKPEQNVTRAEMAKLVYVLYTTFTDAGAGVVKFDDVKADHWATGYISWCASKNIIGGFGDGNFGPNDNVTYDQALKMVAGTLGYNEWDSAQWPTDVRMKALNDLDLGKDMPETVKGSDKLTRAQVAQIMYNALEADMKETKNEPKELMPGVTINVPVAKTLAEDVWKFTKVTYTVEKATTKDGVTTLTLGYKDETGADKDAEYKLSELGLEAYEGKAADFIDFELVGLRKNGEELGVPSLLGTIKDGVKVSFKTTKKDITIDGKVYDDEDFAAGAKNIITIKVDGTKVENVFDANGELAKVITNALTPNAQYLARTIDYQGDGYIDVLEIEPKIAYMVENVKTVKGETTVTLKQLDGDGTLKIDAKNINIELAEKDVVVAATLGSTTYAEKVEATTTYATRLNEKAGKVTLNNVGEVIFADQTVAGIGTIAISTADLGSDNADTYYIYNGEVLLKETVKTASDYTFAVLRYVEESDSKRDPISMTMKTAYTANILVIEDGKLVEKSLPLSEADGKELMKDYPAEAEVEVNVGTDSNPEMKKVISYNYALVSSYEENKDGYYDIKLAKDGLLDADDEDYLLITGTETFKYAKKTKLFSIGSQGKIKLDDNTVIFYKDKLKTGAAKGFTDLKFYTKASLTEKDFQVATADAAVLVKDETDRYTLLATIVAEEIKGLTGDKTADYTNDGRLILYAPESSSTELVDGKLYNSYIFMDNATIENLEAKIDTNVEYHKTDNAGTEEGYLYGYDTVTEKYVKVTAGLGLETIEATKLVDVLLEEGLIEYTKGNSTDFIHVPADVIIWGLAEVEKNNEYAKLTLDELDEMLELVNEYNKDADIDFDVDLLLTYYYDSNDDLVLASVIVEIFEADEDDDTIIYSVNDLIFKNFAE